MPTEERTETERLDRDQILFREGQENRERALREWWAEARRLCPDSAKAIEYACAPPFQDFPNV